MVTNEIKGDCHMSVLTRLNPLEAADFLGCSYVWLMRRARKQQIPHYRIGCKVFFTKEQLTLWIQSQEAKSTQEGKP